ncbi:toll/interleukin-1 receptor domain-containing protein [Streptomyces harbinensis]|uniref:toll/interleukin-1 receptor domain-containing protein n=1 Tax=Streptomyces harbinensis TaxID=1176198 RepID=UPI003395741F
MPASKEIFVNYRTGDEEMAAALIQRELCHRFGADHVFYASNSIRAGLDYKEELEDAIRRCRILLAVIGPRWTDFPTGDGGRALDNADDWTRREIHQAHEYGIPVIPVLIGRKMSRLKESDLPPELAFLASAQYVRYEHRSDSDLDHLVEEVLHHLPELAQKDRNNTAAQQETAGARPGTQHNSVEHNTGTVNQMGNVSGGVHTNRTEHSGTTINQPSGAVNTGSGAQYNSQFSGDIGTVNQNSTPHPEHKDNDR